MEGKINETWSAEEENGRTASFVGANTTVCMHQLLMINHLKLTYRSSLDKIQDPPHNDTIAAYPRWKKDIVNSMDETIYINISKNKNNFCQHSY
jgi:hypothetical protein